MSNKIVLITDQHFQARKTSKQFHDYFLEFYNNIFFPYLEENNIKTVIDLGDTFDNRNYVDPSALDWAKSNYYDRLERLGIDHHIIVGNHTAKLKNTNRISSVDLILREYKNIKVYKDPSEAIINELKILFIPWINNDNECETFDIINKTDAKVAMGHLELNGFIPYIGHVMEDGRPSEIFSKFDKVFSGHFHTRSDNGKIFYIGNPYEIYFNDIDDVRGFAIFDPETLVHDYVNNPYRMHYQFFYEGESIPIKENLKDKIVKIVVRKKENIKEFEDFIETINKMQPMELKIMESVEAHDMENFESLETEDTFTILNRYIDNTELNYDKSKIKSIINETYREILQTI
jgi:hypothetical protein